MNKYKKFQQDFLESRRCSEWEYFKANFKPSADDLISALLALLMFVALLALLEILSEVPK